MSDTTTTRLLSKTIKFVKAVFDDKAPSMAVQIQIAVQILISNFNKKQKVEKWK